mmetsp:Transcript_32222/g.52234  ORF Transcript_32222/g.52234 Transcript_32222/m.52234 type:complete len:142 (-) Transcript_32222:441-866(-)
MSNIRPGEINFQNEWNECTVRVVPNVDLEPQVRHMIWMIANKDAIGNDGKVVRTRTRITNPYTKAKTAISSMSKHLANKATNNGFKTTPLKDTSPPPPPGAAPVVPAGGAGAAGGAPAPAPAPPTNRQQQHLLDLNPHLTM